MCKRCEHWGQDFPPPVRKEGKNIAARRVRSGLRSEFAQLLTDSLDIESNLLSIKKSSDTIMHFFPSPTHAHRIKVFTGGQLISTFLGKRLYFFGISETRICFLKNPCHWIPFCLTCDWNFCFNPFSIKAAFIFIKDDKQKPLLLSLHFSAFMFCHSELFFSFPLSVFFSPSCRQHPAPPVTVLTELQERTLLQSSLWRISYKSL